MDWILDNCESYDAGVIAGDIVDMDSNSSVHKQIGDCLDWGMKLSKRTELTLSSGNHDYAYQPLSIDFIPSLPPQVWTAQHWLCALRSDSCIVSTETRVATLKSGKCVVISALHWHFHSTQFSAKPSMGPWICVHGKAGAE